MSGRDFAWRDLRGAKFDGAKLEGANFSGADLRGADFLCADLRRARFDSANLEGATLRGARLEMASLVGANLRRANLCSVTAVYADFTGAKMTDANLNDGNFAGAEFRGANIFGADIYGANLWEADFREIWDDLYKILDLARKEVPAVLAALRSGKVWGDSSSDDLAGTIAKARGCPIEFLKGIYPANSRPVSRWFRGIRMGDTPENSEIVRLTVEHIEGWLATRK
jgi:hypothetical protein